MSVPPPPPGPPARQVGWGQQPVGYPQQPVPTPRTGPEQRKGGLSAAYQYLGRQRAPEPEPAAGHPLQGPHTGHPVSPGVHPNRLAWVIGGAAVAVTGLLTIVVLGFTGGGGFPTAQAAVEGYVKAMNEGVHNPDLFCPAYRSQADRDADRMREQLLSKGAGGAGAKTTATAGQITESGTSGSAVVTLEAQGPAGSLRISNKLALTQDDGWTICGVTPEIDFPRPLPPGSGG